METAQEFQTWVETQEDKTSEEACEKLASLPYPERYKVLRRGSEELFVPENAGAQTESLSPSGRYRVVTTDFATKPGCWEYTRQEVFTVSEGKLVATVLRNYCNCSPLFVENHRVTGHDYMISGDDYQGHTVCDLTTGEAMRHIPNDAYSGFGWCPITMELLEDGNILMMGCFWACPLNYRVYDFSDPMPLPEKGLKELTEDLWLDSNGESEIKVTEDKITLTSFKRKFRETGEWEYPDFEDKSHALREREHKAKISNNEPEMAAVAEELKLLDEKYQRWDRTDLWENVPDSTTVFIKGEDSKFREAPELCWKSEKLLAEEEKRRVWKEEDQKLLDLRKSEDLIFQEVKREWPEDFITRCSRYYPSWISRWEGDTNAFHFEVLIGTLGKEKSAKITWGEKEGPLKLILKTGGQEQSFPMERSSEGFKESLEKGRAFVAP